MTALMAVIPPGSCANFFLDRADRSLRVPLQAARSQSLEKKQ